MTNKEIVIKVLEEHECETSKEIAMSAKRLFKEDLTASAAGAAARALIKEGKVAGSKNGDGQTVYWLSGRF